MSKLQETIEVMVCGLCMNPEVMDRFAKLKMQDFANDCSRVAEESGLGDESAPLEIARVVLKCFDGMKLFQAYDSAEGNGTYKRQ